MAENTATAAAQGTTLAILQAYPLGTLEVHVVAFVPSVVARCVLVGFDISDNNNAPCIVAHYNALGYLLGHGRYRPEELTPILKPFAALCEPLADGTIPAEVLADVVKQSSRYMEIFLRSGAVIKQRGGEGPDEPSRVEIWGEHTATAVFTIFSDFTFYTALQTDYAAICETLRRLHFALPVNGRPLVEGIDYIAKPASGAPTIEKGEAS